MALSDNETAYGEDQDRGPASSPVTRNGLPGDGLPSEALPVDDRSPDDIGPDEFGDREINPETGMEYGAIDR